MTPARFLATAIDPALALLPLKMASDQARAMVLAVCWQESKLSARRQQPTGPARGFAQFERDGGVAGVLSHRSSRVAAAKVCQALVVEASVEAVYRAIEFQDVLAAAFARLLLWTVPDPMPGKFEPEIAWRIYLKAWRPGKPKPEAWPESYAVGWQTVEGRTS
jgi:hypothetical protein